MWNEIVKIGSFMVTVLAKVWPYLLISLPLGIAVRLSPAGEYLKRTLNKRPIVGILLGTLFGALSPLCSCTVIPVIYSLLVAGVPLGAVMAFWIASPSMDPEIFFLSVTTLGWPLAVWRLAATFILSLSAGFITQALFQGGFFKSGILKKDPELRTVSFRKLLKTLFQRTKPQPATTCCDKPAVKARAPAFTAVTTTAKARMLLRPAAPAKPKEKPFRERLWKESVDSLAFVGKFMLIAYFLEALIVLYLPQEWVLAVLGGNGFLSVLTATAVGIPLYTTNIAAMGMLGGLLQKGMSGGAVLAFLIAGPTTTLPAMSAVFGIAKPRVFFVYLAFALLGALLFGSIFLVFGGM